MRPVPTPLPLSFDRFGPADAPPIVLVHGITSNRRSFRDGVVEHVCAAFADTGRAQVVNLDLRGHGISPHASADAYDHASYATDVAGLLETLGTGPAILIGHSLGSVVAFSLAASQPSLVRALYLGDPPLYEGDRTRFDASPTATVFPATVAAVRALQARGAPADDYTAWLSQGPTSAAEIAKRVPGLLTWDPATLDAAISGDTWRDFDPDAPITCPVTVVAADPACGAVFTPTDAVRFAAANPHAVLEMVVGAGHTVHAAPTLPAYLEALDRFFASLQSTT